jgi:hypothetical protein
MYWTFALLIALQGNLMPSARTEVEVSVVLERRSFVQGQGTLLKILLVNNGPRTVRVPRYFPHGPGYPGVRIAFTSSRGQVTYSPTGGIWPEPRELPADYEQKTISLETDLVYGNRVVAVLPEQPGCYQMKVLFSSWTSSKSDPIGAQTPVMLGDHESPSYKVCIRARNKATN